MSTLSSWIIFFIVSFVILSIRIKVVNNARIKAVQQIRLINSELIAAGRVFECLDYNLIDQVVPGSQVMDLRKWTAKQFYPGLFQ